MRYTLQNGVFTIVLGLLGAGAVIVWPNQVWIGWSLMLAAVAVLLWGVKVDGEHWWARGRSRMILAYGLIVVSLGGLATGITLLRRGEPTPQLASPPSEPPPDITRLVLECQNVGDFTVISGSYSSLLVFPNPPENGGATSLSTVSGSGPAKAGELGITHACKLTNYGPASLINVRIPLRLTFYEHKVTQQKGGGHTSETGALKLDREALMVVPRIEMGPLESFSFYIGNNSQLVAGVDFLDKAEAQRVDRMNREIIAVSTTMHYPVVSFPKVN